jgi:hypothetical protein
MQQKHCLLSNSQFNGHVNFMDLFYHTAALKMLTGGWRYSTGKPDIGFECYCWIVVVMETAVLEFLNNLWGLGTE